MQVKRYGVWEDLNGNGKMLLFESDNLDEAKFSLERFLYRDYEMLYTAYQRGELAQKPGNTYLTAIEALRETAGYEIYDDEKETVVQ